MSIASIIGRIAFLVPLTAVLCGAWSTLGVAAEEESETAQLAKKIDPSVVTVEVPYKGQGSGFLLGSTGSVVTNYHVIEGAKKVTVVLHDKTKVEADGFLAIAPGKDLAILSIKLPDKSHEGLSLAKQAPSKVDKVLAFGSPLGLTGSVSDGIVSAVRPSKEIREILKDMFRKDVYVDGLQYDLDATWIQTTAPISPSNSGGPLVGSNGTVARCGSCGSSRVAFVRCAIGKRR